MKKILLIILYSNFLLIGADDDTEAIEVRSDKYDVLRVDIENRNINMLTGMFQSEERETGTGLGLNKVKHLVELVLEG